MAERPQHLLITALRAYLRADGGFDFWTFFDSPHGPRRIMVAAEHLLDYAAFQVQVLRRTGMVFRHIGCEGRRPEAANEAWRSFTALIEYAHEPAEPPPAGVEDGPVH